MSILSRKSLTRQAFQGALALTLAVTASQSHAVMFGTPGQGVSGSFDVIASYSNLFRVEEQDDDSYMLTKLRNNDDGNRNFSRGLVSNMVKAVVDFGIKNDVSSATTYGLFIRGYALYDFAIQGEDSDHDVPEYNNFGSQYSSHCTPTDNCFSSEMEERAGSNSEILDAFVYADLFQDTEHPLSIKLGKQLINWGESLFIQTGLVNAINAADVTRAAIPGTEIKEILLPAYAASFNVAVTENISFAGFYKFEDRKTIAPPPGSFFSTVDFIGPGSDIIQIDPFGPTVTLNYGGTIGKDDDNNEYGFALTWFSETLWDTEFGFYWAKLNDRVPGLAFELGSDPANADRIADSSTFDYSVYGSNAAMFAAFADISDTSYFLHDYKTQYNVWAASFNTTLPGWSVFETSMSGELVWREGYGIQVYKGDGQLALGPLLGAAFFGGAPDGTQRFLNEAGDLVTAQLTFNNKITLPWLADDITMLIEFGVVHTPGMGSDPTSNEPWRGSVRSDSTALGYKSKTMLTYFEALSGIHPVLSGTDVKVTIAWNQDFHGDSAITAGSFYSGARSLGLSVDATWQSNLSVGLTYNMFWWDDEETQYGDRDVAGMVVKYSF